MLYRSGILKSNEFIARVDIEYLPPKLYHIEPWNGSGVLLQGNVVVGNKYKTNFGKIVVVNISCHKLDASEIIIFSFVGQGRIIL